MKPFLTSLVVLGLALAARADDPPKQKSTPAEQLAALQKEHKAAEAAFFKAVQPLPDTKEGEKKYREIFQAYDKGQGERFAAAVALAKADPKSEVALSALEWVLTIPRAYFVPAGKPAINLALEHHAANPKIGKIISWLGYYAPQPGVDTYEPAWALIKAVAEKNPDRTARGQAVMALAWEAKRRFSTAEFKKTADVEQLAAKAEQAFELVVKDYGNCSRLIRPDSGTLGERAGRELFELRNLRIGKVAPDIEGEDLDGVKFKLSDYRGKVVLLDFWGDW